MQIPYHTYFRRLTRTSAKAQQGHILIASIMATLGISVTGAALVNLALGESDRTNARVQRSAMQALAESCISETGAWLRQAQHPPTVLPYDIQRDSKDLTSEEQNRRFRTKLSEYQIHCAVTGSPSTPETPTIKSEVHSLREGESLAASSGYGLSGDLSPKIYYWLRAESTDAHDSRHVTQAVLSAIY